MRRGRRGAEVPLTPEELQRLIQQQGATPQVFGPRNVPEPDRPPAPTEGPAERQARAWQGLFGIPRTPEAAREVLTDAEVLRFFTNFGVPSDFPVNQLRELLQASAAKQGITTPITRGQLASLLGTAYFGTADAASTPYTPAAPSPPFTLPLLSPPRRDTDSDSRPVSTPPVSGGRGTTTRRHGGLSHLPPPAPAKAIHQAELDAQAERDAHDLDAALFELLTTLFFPHSEWWLGRGSAVNPTTHQVTATLNGAAGVAAQPATFYQAGTGATPTVAQLRAQRLVLVVAILKDDPPTFHRFVDWTLEATPTPPLPQPPPAIEPATPAAIPIRKETYQQYVLQEATHFDDVYHWSLQHEALRRFLKTLTRFAWGRAVGINTTAKTITVRWDDVDNNVGAPSTAVAWGTRRWTRATIVGHRVRVERGVFGSWIDDVDDASGRV